MMDLRTLQAVNRRATHESQRARNVPALIAPGDVAAYRAGDQSAVFIPFIGDREPRGYKRIGPRLFCDKSGFGDEREPAWTLDHLLRYIEAQGESYWGAVEEGQFQIYVQQFERVR